MDEDDVCEFGDIGDDRSCDGKTLPAFRIGELISFPLGAENSRIRINKGLFNRHSILYQFNCICVK